MLSLNKKITANKTKHFLNDNDLSCYRGKQYFDEGSGKQNYLVFLPINKYLKLNSVANTADYVLSWQSKGLSDESIKPPTTTNSRLTPELNYYGTKTKIKFTGSCLKQSSYILTHEKVVNIYIVYERIVQERISQCAVCNVYKFFSKHSPDYFEELFFPTEETAI